MGQLIDIVGEKYGRMLVISKARSLDGNARWNCRCDCGTEKVVYGQDLRRGKVVSCGCHKAEMASKRATHRMSGHPAHNSWKSAKARCEVPTTEGYEQYGGRGIKVCDRWQSFENFWIDMGPTWRPNRSLDRHPNQDGNYEPGNCRWATASQQGRNRRTNHTIQTPSGPMMIVEAAEKYGLDPRTIAARIRYGWTDPNELVKPPMKKTEYLKQYRK